MLQWPKAGGDVVWDVAGTGRDDYKKNGIRFQNENRTPIFLDYFLIGLMIAIKKKFRDPIRKWKSRSGFDPEIADRFSYENRIPICRSDCGNSMRAVFSSLIDFEMKIDPRFFRNSF
jgi:hypothetical protein